MHEAKKKHNGCTTCNAVDINKNIIYVDCYMRNSINKRVKLRASCLETRRLHKGYVQN